MTRKVKEAVGAMSDALETACGWALGALVIYALLFVNLTGNGVLWDSLRDVVRDVASAPVPRNSNVQVRVVPVRPVDEMAKAQNRMLSIPEELEKTIALPVLAQQQPLRVDDQVADALADANAGKDWRKHLSGELRTFTVYGESDQRGPASVAAISAGIVKGASEVSASSAREVSASATARQPVPAAATIPAATPATDASAYRAGIMAETRPGVIDHVAPVDAAADGLQNFR